GIAQVPDHPPVDNRREIHFVSQAMAMLFVSQEVGGQGQATPRQDGRQPLVAKRTDQAVKGYRGEMADHRAQFQTEPSMRRSQGVADPLGSHRAIAQDEMREDREYGFAPCALDPPDGETTQPDTDIMRVADKTPAPATARRVGELK